MRNRIVTITGASSAVGRETAFAFARKGAVVVLIARRRGALERVAQHCRHSAAAVLAHAADPDEPEAVAEVAADVHRRFGRIDVWVNAASVNMLAAAREPDAAWLNRVERRLFGTYHTVRHVLPYMRAQGAGTVVNVPSVLCRPGPAFGMAFAAGKDAMRAVTYCLRRELADAPGVAVSTVLPGPSEPPGAEASDDGALYTRLVPILDPRRGARAVVSSARRAEEGEVIVDGTPGPLRSALAMVPAALARLSPHFGKDPLYDTLTPTMEHRILRPDELRAH